MSMTLLEQMKSSISPQSTSYAAKLLGESQAKIDSAVALAVPSILSAMASNAHISTGTGGQSLVSRHVSDPVNDGSLLHRLPALYQGTMTAAPIYRLGGQLLQTIFGTNLGQFTQTVASISGIKPSSAALLVNTIAPHILSVVGKRHRLSGDATPHGLINLLDIESSALKAAIPASLLSFTAASSGPAAVASATASAKPTASAAQPAKTAPVKTAPAKAAPVTATKSIPAVDAVYTTVPKHQPHVAQPTVVKQSYRWASWLPILAIYGAGAAGIAMISTYQGDTPSGTVPIQAPQPAQTAIVTPPPAATPSVGAPIVPPKPPAKAVEVKPADVKPAETKVAETKPAEAKSSQSADSKPADAKAKDKDKEKEKEKDKKPEAPATVPMKTAEIAKPADTTKPTAAPVAPAPAATKSEPAAQQDVSARANPYKPPTVTASPDAPLVNPAKTAAATAAAVTATTTTDTTAKPAPAASAPQTVVVLPPPAKGVTTYFGATPRDVEVPARANPDYKPSPPPVEVKPEVAAAPPTATPAAAAAAASVPVPAAPVKTATPSSPSLAEQAISAVKELIAPAPQRPAGTTSYFGSAPTPPEAAARPNPDYKPATSTAAAAPPATPSTAGKPAPPTPPTAVVSGPGAPASTASDAVLACRTSLKTAARGGRIAFQSSKADLRNSSIAMLDRIAAALNSCSTVRVTIEGHTDNTGRAESNQALSLARAKTVADYLAAKGIDAARIAAVGLGSTRPIAPNNSTLNKARNRRIEFNVGTS